MNWKWKFVCEKAERLGRASALREKAGQQERESNAAGGRVAAEGRPSLDN
jgi:hypothetical protein